MPVRAIDSGDNCTSRSAIGVSLKARTRATEDIRRSGARGRGLTDGGHST